MAGLLTKCDSSRTQSAVPKLPNHSKGMMPFEERQRKADSNRKIYIAVAALAVAAGLVCAVSCSIEHSGAAAVNLAAVTAIEPRSPVVRALRSAR